MSYRRALLVALGLAVFTAGVFTAVIAFRWKLTAASVAGGLGIAIAGLGLGGTGYGHRTARYLLLTGAALLIVPRIAYVARAVLPESMRLVTLPDSGRRVVNSFMAERDGVLVAAELAARLRFIPDVEAPEFRHVLAQAYDRMGAPSEAWPTPAIASYLGLQTPRAFDTIVMEPPRSAGEQKSIAAAVIFLHGFGGNFNVFCWEAAQAAIAANLIAVCPSLGPAGDWWSPRGDAVVTEALSYLRGRGISRVYLAGLSNGGYGAGEIAYRRSRDFAGVILISGTSRKPPPPIPVLVIQGGLDRMAPAASARRYAMRGRVQYREIAGVGHLAFLSRHETVRRLVTEFLLANERRRARRVF